MDNSSDVKILIDGLHASFVYDDTLAELAADGTTRRVSHVEPAIGYCLVHGPTLDPSVGDPVTCGELGCDLLTTGWVANMKPSGGPILGPFALRSEALAAERQWLADTWGL